MENIQSRFIHDKELKDGAEFVASVLKTKGFKSIDEVYDKGYEIVWNEKIVIIFNIRKVK